MTKTKDEEVLIYSRENSPTAKRIKEFAESADTELKGYKQKMYQLTEMLPENFVKVNQSCIVSIEKISRFEATLGAFRLCGGLFFNFNIVRRGLREYN